MASRSRVGFDDRESLYRDERRSNVEVRVLDRERERDRVPTFLREDNRRPEPGPLVLRQREVETSERIRRRSPSPVRHVRARSVSPVQFRTVRAPSRGPSEVDRVRIIERDRSSSPSPERTRARFVERRPRSPSPDFHERIRIVEKERERERPRSPTPPPQPQVIKGPIIEREVITHYRDIDHGVMVVRQPSPSPPPQPRRRDLTDIDIYTSRKETEIDIKRSSSRGPSRAPSRHRGRSRSVSRERVSRPHRHEGDVFLHADTGRLHVDVEARHSHSHGRRAHSEAPPRHHDYEFDEAREITSRIDAGGRMGEARNGITKDWTIVDVPPGTERVRMDGAGGASAEVTWSKYSGVRRSKFIPDRDEKSTVISSSSTNISERERERDMRDDPRRSSRLSVSIYDKDTHGSKDREIDVISDRRGSSRHPHSPGPRGSEMWTEITKDLVIREAIEEMGYEYEETEYFYYIMTYLRYEDVLQLVQLSDAVRRARKDRLHEIQWSGGGYQDEYEREYRIHSHSHSHSHSRPDERRSKRYHGDERVVEREREVSYETRGSRGYR
ncbi:hypothetical protein QBC39DRAFT_3035 [Podospora conica]|nr:hypothetical protein QBC39DRAFT_3035 [Schizothecium conicum]